VPLDAAPKQPGRSGIIKAVNLMSDIPIGAYIPGDSLVHRLDPRAKLAGFVLMLIGIFVSPDPWGVAVSGVVVAAAAGETGIGMRTWVRGMARFLFMLSAAAVLNLIFVGTGDPVIVAHWRLPFTTDGVRTGLLFTVQLAEAIALSLVLTFTTAPAALTRGLEWAALPLKRLKVPVEDYGMVALLAMRFIPLLQEELRTIIDAQKSRGIEFGEGSIIARARNLVAVLAPALTGALRRADILADAMTARGFRPGAPRSHYRPMQFSAPDLWVLGGIALFFLCRVTLLR
jgi:energy-coupling factor transport system permease protein